MPRFLTWALVFCLLVLPVKAADLAEHRILGFSSDGAIFAFEEFGVQDGSGFPYANIYFIDAEADAWLPGTPVRVIIDDMAAVEAGQVDLSTARDEAYEKARPILDEHGIEDRWHTHAYSALGEFEASPNELAFGIQPRWNALADIEDRFRAELDLYYAETPGQDCADYMGDRPMGFRLTIQRLDSDGVVTLHEDETIPRSRGCPVTYRITRVVSPDAWPVEKVMVLLSVMQHGFEGANRRFIAVAGRLPD